jgi:hypothetical protein
MIFTGSYGYIDHQFDAVILRSCGATGSEGSYPQRRPLPPNRHGRSALWITPGLGRPKHGARGGTAIREFVMSGAKKEVVKRNTRV